MAEKQNLEVQQLVKIQKRLEEIEERTATNTKRAFFYGLLQGAGAVIGGIAAVILLGWLLSIVGVIPGLADIADNVRGAMMSWRGR